MKIDTNNSNIFESKLTTDDAQRLLDSGELPQPLALQLDRALDAVTSGEADWAYIIIKLRHGDEAAA